MSTRPISRTVEFGGGGGVRQSQLSSRIWLLSLYCLLFLQIASALKCLGSEQTVATYPQGEIHIQYGSPLEIFCTVDNGSVKDLRFSVGGKTLSDVTIHNDTTICLYIEKPDIQRLIYYCRNNATKTNCINTVLVDTPPKDVTDFKCTSYNMDAMNCSWTTPTDAKSTFEYSLKYFMNLKPTNQECSIDRVRDTRTSYCLYSLSVSPPQAPYRQSLETYLFNLTSCNKFGCNMQNITLDHFSVVKPSPPENLKVIEINPHNVTLQWGISTSIRYFLKCGLDYKIEYQIAKIDDPKNFDRKVNVTSLNAEPQNLTQHKTFKFELTNLPYAHMQYEVRVYIKSKKAEGEDMWSDYAFVPFRTASEIPHRPPEMPAGAFSIINFLGKRMIHVYWKQLEEYEECAANFTYMIEIKQNSTTDFLFPNENEGYSHIVLPNATAKAISVSVRSKNEIGLSKESSHLYIPAKTDILEGPSSFTKLAYANSTYELSWDINDIGNIDNYTLFWCRYNTTKVCSGRVNYTTLAPTKKIHFIDLPAEHRYQFALSVNRGIRTSGMVWAKCDISKDAKNYDIPITLNHESLVNSSVVISWTLDCTLSAGIVKGYRINYCPIIDTSNLCDNSVENHNVTITDTLQKSINITGLLYYRTYQFTFNLITTYGTIESKRAVTRVTMPEGIPSMPTNIMISDIKHDSVVVSYDPPLKRNGNIVVYNIFRDDTLFSTDKAGLPNATDLSRRNITIHNLNGFTNYTWRVQACNKHCSDLTPALAMRTSIGPPERLRPDLIQSSDGSTRLIKWEAPNETGRHVDLYQIKRVKDGKEEIFNTTDTVYTIDCYGVAAYYHVRAVNIDNEPNHGARSDDSNIILPKSGKDILEYPGEWSDPPVLVDCGKNDIIETILTLMALCVALALLCYGLMKYYKDRQYRKNIAPEFPEGLSVPERKEKDINKHPLYNIFRKDDKPCEEKLLPDSKPVISSPDIKQKDEHSVGVDHTNSTTLSDTSKEPIESEPSTSDTGSDCSLDIEPVQDNEKSDGQTQGDTSSEATSSAESPLVSNTKKTLSPGYQPPPTVSASPGYVSSNFKLPYKPQPQPTSASYVTMSHMGPPSKPRISPGYVVATPVTSSSGLPPTIIHTNARPALNQSGYVRQEEVQGKHFMNFPKLGLSPTKPENSPVVAKLPPLPKHDAGSFQLQALDSLPSLKSPHLNTCLPGAQGADDPAILDPNVMSPDAYCRFSWNTNPENDNLHSLHADLSTNNSTKNN